MLAKWSGRVAHRKRRRSKREKRQHRIEALEKRQLLARDVAGLISADETWSDTIRVTGDVTIAADAELTIAAGTVVKFDVGRSLNVDGSIVALGTSSQQITFTSVQDDSVGEDLTVDVGTPAEGDWRALLLNDGDAGVTLQHVNVQYAGRSNQPALQLGKDSTSLNDVVVSNVADVGVLVDGSPALNRVTVQESETAFAQTITASPNLQNLVATNNDVNAVLLSGGSTNGDQTWSFGGLPVHLQSTVLVESGSLTVAPGSVIKIPPNTGHYIQASGGPLIAKGTAADPIIVTSTSDDSVGGDSNADGDATVPAAGDIRSLFLYHGDSELEHFEYRYGGRNSGDEGIRIDEQTAGTNGRSVSLTNVRVINSEREGIDIIAGNPTLHNVQVTDSGGPAIIQAGASQATYNNVFARDNAGGDHVRLGGHSITTDRTWDFGMPVHMVGTTFIAAGGSLGIAPGSVIKIGANSGHYIQASGGPLIAQGTADAPITITSTSDDTVGGDSNADGDVTLPLPGDLRALFLNHGDSTLEHFEYRYGGRNSGDEGIRINQTTAGVDGRSVSLANVRVVSSEREGIGIDAGDPTLSNVSVTGSGGPAIIQVGASEAVYDGVTVRSNAGGDHVSLGRATIDSDRVWDFDGIPIHLSNTAFIGPNGSLTIAPGSVIKIVPNSGHYIQASGGPLIAQGTADAPIIVTSTADDSVGGDSNADGDATSPSPGDLRALFLNHGDSTLEHFEYRYGGRNSGDEGIRINQTTAGVDGRSVSLLKRPCG